jgi:uncharacterized repeat protein (TIGR02543 family)
MTNTYLPKYFGATGISNIGVTASGLYDVTISTSGASGASVKINTVAPKTGSWKGKYYAGVPITVTAVVPSGYTFDGWTVTNGTAASPSEKTTTVTFTGNTTITAKFK